MTRPTSTVHHDPIPSSPPQPADAATVNRPDAELDAAIGVVDAKIGDLTGVGNTPKTSVAAILGTTVPPTLDKTVNGALAELKNDIIQSQTPYPSPAPCDGDITRDANGYITSVALNSGITVTITRDANHLIMAIDNTIVTWSFTRDGLNRIASWVIAYD